MEEEVPFEAEHVLQELYNLDAVVQGVQAGTWERYIRLPPLLSAAALCMWRCCSHPHNCSCHSPLLCSCCCCLCNCCCC